MAWAEIGALGAGQPRDLVVGAVRAALDQHRRCLLDGATTALPRTALVAAIEAHLAQLARPHLRRVINATGIVLHTNLGRAPLAPVALDAVLAAAQSYSNLELDLDEGRRGSRHTGVAALLRELTGAGAALVVNNNAAAMLLALAATAAGGEVVVSRGELIEIGGSFRIPDIIRQSGARLVEVGTTNRTRLDDYRSAIGPDTRLLLKVHPSNYRITGFTAAVGIAEVARLAHEHGLLALDDLGSGALVAPPQAALQGETTVGEALAAGADLVTCSGDKLLGGPQAGIVTGRAEVVARLASHPLMRPLRSDKLTLAALEATLRLYRDRDALPRTLPVMRMLAQKEPELEARGQRLLHLLGTLAVAVEPSEGFAGGGALPEERIPSRQVALALGPDGPDAQARRLRQGDPAVVGRISGGRLVLDMLTVADDEIDPLAGAVRAALA